MGNLITAHGNEIIFAVATILGMLGHYLKKKLKNETQVNLKEWFGSSHWPGSIAALGSAATVIVAALSNGVIVESMSFWAVAYVGLTTGFAIDSTTNSDEVAHEAAKAIKAEKAII